MTIDRDLQSIQEARDLVLAAKKAAGELAAFSQERLDAIVKEIAKDCAENAERLAKLAVEETGYGVWQDKLLKNLLGSTMTYDYIKDMRVVGVLSEDAQRGLMEVGVPVGVIAALIPSTNPTSTTMYKALIAIKAGNSIVFSPHPSAINCILETARVIEAAAKRVGAPEGTVGCIKTATPEATSELMKSRDVGLILATGGEAMVRAAYSSGNPAIGVGPGNGPAFIDKSADIEAAVRRIVESKTFDNGTICASEQSVIVERSIEAKVEEQFKKLGAYFLPEADSKKLAGYILRANGTMNPQIVGKTAKAIAALADIEIPQDTKVLLSRQTEVSKKNPYTREKLCPILAFFVEADWEGACARSIEILHVEGAGHTMTIHAKDQAVIREFALKKPVSRLLVNVAAALGGVGALTNLAPALTLGCGSVGGSSTSDNITPKNLINIRRVAWGFRELADLRGKNPAPEGAVLMQSSSIPVNGTEHPVPTAPPAFTKDEIEQITRAVLKRLGQS